MKKKNIIPEDVARLRQKAEDQLKMQESETNKNVPEAELLKLIHELQVHQIELEMQNEELAIAREKAELAEEKYTEIYDFAPSGYLSISKDGTIVELNFATAHMLGKVRSKLINHCFALFISQETLAVFNLFFQKVFTSKVKQTCEVMITTEGNLPIYVNIEGILSQNDEFCHLTLIDITERKKTEEALRANEEKYRQITENISDVVWVTDTELNTVYISSSIEKLIGESVDCHMNRSLEEKLPPDSLNKLLHTFQEEMEKEKDPLSDKNRTRIIEVQHYKADGSLIWVSMHISAHRDKDGNVTGFQGATRDIAKRKKAEIEILKLNESLEQRVLERTKQLQESNNALEAFSHSISHDLRSPLRSMVGFSQILIEEYQPILGSEGSRLLQIVIDSTNKMNDLIDGLLKLSKANYVTVNKIPIDMNQILTNVITNFIQPYDTSKVSFQIDKLIEGLGDPTLIKQVWFNIVSNAVKFSSKHPSPHIIIKSYKEDNFIVYLIKDNGVGFNPEYKDKIYTTFNRFHSSDEFEGTGVGLALVHRIIQKHGGTIWAESTEGEGATFYFSLPLTNT